jgi:hypothetical protein
MRNSQVPHFAVLALVGLLAFVPASVRASHDGT